MGQLSDEKHSGRVWASYALATLLPPFLFSCVRVSVFSVCFLCKPNHQILHPTMLSSAPSYDLSPSVKSEGT